jgi:ABC-type multidrug transport system fused ATPase/permease subunit
MSESSLKQLIYRYYSENKGILAGTFTSSLASLVIYSILLPRAMARLFTNVGKPEEAKSDMIKLLCLWSVVQVVYGINDYYNNRVESTITKFITDRLVEGLFNKYECNDKNVDTVEMATRMFVLKVNAIELFNRVVTISPVIANIIAIVLNLASYNKELAVMAFSLIFIEVYALFLDSQKCLGLVVEDISIRDRLLSHINDRFENVHIVGSVKGAIRKEIQECSLMTRENQDCRIELLDCVSHAQYRGYAMNIVVFGAIMYYSYRLYSSKRINAEAFTSIMLTMQSLFDSMYDLVYYIPDTAKIVGVLLNNKKFVENLFSYVPRTGKWVDINKGEVVFSKVTYKYPEGKEVFEKKSAYIPPFKKTALYGPSGKGKTTFVKLLYGKILPLEGKIWLDGIDVETIDPDCLRLTITYVSQNTSSLFNTTILKNILYGHEDDEEGVKAKVAAISDKYGLHRVFGCEDTRYFDIEVGKNGELLSGGQRQLIHLLRAINNKDSKILILDESTSALDDNLRDIVIDIINQQFSGKTVVFITHDNVIRDMCDNVIRF